MSPRRYTADPQATARAALALGPLTPANGGMRFGRRLFSRGTVNDIIAAGEAERLEDGSVVARFLRPTGPQTKGER